MKELQRRLQEFNAERDWDKYHSPKNLAIGISVEANELLDLFMWMTEDESKQPSEQRLERIKEEVGDVTIQLVNFCHKLGIDPVKCAYEKIEINRKKYPVERSFGSAKKYDELD